MRGNDRNARRRALAVAGIWMAGLAAMLSAPADAQTVQLPSFSRFSYSGSVLVPDRGTASLGGTARSATQRSRRSGLPAVGPNRRGLGGQRQFGGAAAKVTIIDHEAIDRRFRGIAARGRQRAPVQSPSRGRGLTGRVTGRPRAATPDADRRTPDVGSRGLGGGSEVADTEGKALVRFARRQFRQGNRAAAFDAYRLAIQRLSPRLARLAETEFKRLFPNQVRPAAGSMQRFRSPE